MTRIYERQTDALFAKALVDTPAFAAAFLIAIDGLPENRIVALSTQTSHRGAGNRGSVDLEVTRADGSILLIENKIDAGYSVTKMGNSQPERYQTSVETLKNWDQKAASVLLAPEIYLAGTRHADAFDHLVRYEALRCTLNGRDLTLLDAAIAQAATPYDPVPNDSSGAFHADLKAFAALHFPELVIKNNPNGNGVRPSGSNTIYFDVPLTLKKWPHLPRPRMSLQCRDLGAPSASAKIMLSGMACQAGNTTEPGSLLEIGGYIRPAGQSLGLVLDTPQLDIQQPFNTQVKETEEGLEAVRKLTAWWNYHAKSLQMNQGTTMNKIDSTVNRIPSMNAKKRASLRKNAEDKLQETPKDARRILKELDAFEDANSQPQNLKKTGLLGWEKRPSDHKIYAFRAYHDGHIVGKIFKRADHSGTEKDVYTIEILDQPLPGKFHHIRDARNAGEVAFAEQYTSEKFTKLGRTNSQDPA